MLSQERENTLRFNSEKVVGRKTTNSGGVTHTKYPET